MKVLKKKLDAHESGESCHCAGGSGCRSRGRRQAGGMAWQECAESWQRDRVTPVRVQAGHRPGSSRFAEKGLGGLVDKLMVNRQRALVVMDANCILGCQSCISWLARSASVKVENLAWWNLHHPQRSKMFSLCFVGIHLVSILKSDRNKYRELRICRKTRLLSYFQAGVFFLWQDTGGHCFILCYTAGGNAQCRCSPTMYLWYTIQDKSCWNWVSICQCCALP